MTVAAIVLAAGEGSRFDGPTHKLLVSFRGRPLVEWAVDAALRASLDATFVVVGAVDLEVPDGAVLVHNTRWRDGQSTSLHAAVDAARAAGHDAVVIGLGDQPLVPADAWRMVAACGARPIATATFGGKRRPPVRLSADVWPLLPASGDEGARAVMRERPDLVTEVPCIGEPIDIDTQEDLDRWS